MYFVRFCYGRRHKQTSALTQHFAHLGLLRVIVVIEHLEEHMQPMGINVIVVVAVVRLFAALLMLVGVMVVPMVTLSTVLMVAVMVHLTSAPRAVVVAHRVGFTSVLVLVLVGEDVQEVFRFLRPLALLHSTAGLAGSREIQDASGSQTGELSQADGHVQLANQLVDGACQVTLRTDRMEKKQNSSD